MTVDPGFGTWEPVRFRGKIGFEGVRCRGVPPYIESVLKNILFGLVVWRWQTLPLPNNSSKQKTFQYIFNNLQWNPYKPNPTGTEEKVRFPGGSSLKEFSVSGHQTPLSKNFNPGE